jgi:DNA-directed RNA polymerase specialized sigma24 family protein
VSEKLLIMVVAARLTSLQTDVLLDTVLLERGTSALAPEYGVSAAAVSRTLIRARDKMRSQFDTAVAA